MKTTGEGNGKLFIGERSTLSAEFLPKIHAARRLTLDFETTSLDYLGGSEAVGAAVTVEADEKLFSFYIPWGHAQGRNFEPDAARRWLIDVVRGKTVAMAHAKFDVEHARKFGVDLESLGVYPIDVQHDAALLDEYRRSYSLDSLANDYLGLRKMDLPKDGLKIWEKDPLAVERYAKYDAELTMRLLQVFEPMLEAEDLTRVRDLECQLIYVTLEMERNGALLDLDKLAEWQQRARQRYVSTILKLHAAVGFRVIPSKRADMIKLFSKFGLPIMEIEATGTASFTDDILAAHSHVPEIQMARDALALDSLSSKYLDKYAAAVDPNTGIIRYYLHQLRADDGGTVGGRYSSSGGEENDEGRKGINIQQVMKPKEQRKIPAIADMIVRELFVAPDGFDFVDSDASQIEYRVFGHLADDENVTKVYQENPRADFHQLLADWCGLDRDTEAKHANFAKIYGSGLKKFALMIKRSPEDAQEIWDRYNRQFPAGERLLRLASELAQKRGYVKTLLGRRRRFMLKRDVRGKADYRDRRTKWHAALNSVIQGSAADLMKLKLLKAYRRRKKLGFTMRFTVHDSLATYNPRGDHSRFDAMMNEQEMELKVPILWDTKAGRSWYA